MKTVVVAKENIHIVTDPVELDILDGNDEAAILKVMEDHGFKVKSIKACDRIS
jgi:hypothetical protein